MLWWRLRQLKSANDETRTRAATRIGLSKQAEAFDHLVLLLEDGASSVRAAAARSLGQIGDSRAVTPLLKLLSDDSADVRERAVNAIGTLGDELAKRSLVKTLFEDHDSYVRLCAARALEQVDTPEIQQALWRAKNYCRNTQYNKPHEWVHFRSVGEAEREGYYIHRVMINGSVKDSHYCRMCTNSEKHRTDDLNPSRCVICGMVFWIRDD
jgi:hypothetical protein